MRYDTRICTVKISTVTKDYWPEFQSACLREQNLDTNNKTAKIISWLGNFLLYYKHIVKIGLFCWKSTIQQSGIAFRFSLLSVLRIHYRIYNSFYERFYNVYRKPTHTNRYLDFFLHHDMTHKISTATTLIGRSLNLPTTEDDKRKELKHVIRASFQMNTLEQSSLWWPKPKQINLHQAQKI